MTEGDPCRAAYLAFWLGFSLFNGGEPAPDTSGGGAPTGNGTFRLPERVDLAWVKSLPQSVYKAHMKEIDAALFGSSGGAPRR